jgi:sulfur-oxidizing protein SoxB
MDQTAITYAASTLNELSGSMIKTILEDIADNLYNPDPYYQQGGDMVRVGGLQYTLNFRQRHGKRISNMVVNGKAVRPDKTYKVAGWASVQPQPKSKQPIWDVVAEYLRHHKTVRVGQPYIPQLKGLGRNPGFSPS